jgi:hypothetical protein
VICDETGCSSWEVHRKTLTPVLLNDRDSWYAEGAKLNQKG